MACACAELMGGRIDAALVAGPRISGAQIPRGWQHVDSSHPFPNAASVDAGRASLTFASEARNRRLLVLLSGGASSMLCAPVEDISLADKVAATRSLMNAGVAIHDLNCVRKHLSRVKGGRLAAAAPASLTLAMSDVHHPIADDPSVIGSGPGVPDPTTFAQALHVAGQVDLMPQAVLEHLHKGAAGQVEETVKPGDVRLANARFIVVANRETALRAAAEGAAALGYAVTTLPEPTYGEARVAAKSFAARAFQLWQQERKPLCVLAAGETTVRVSGRGIGGRNQEFALALIPEIADFAAPGGDGHAACVVSSVATDGIDGPTPAAGAIVDSTTLTRARRAGLEPQRALEENDAYPFFRALNDLVVLGPTGTNVGDLQVMLVDRILNR